METLSNYVDHGVKGKFRYGTIDVTTESGILFWKKRETVTREVFAERMPISHEDLFWRFADSGRFAHIEGIVKAHDAMKALP